MNSNAADLGGKIGFMFGVMEVAGWAWCWFRVPKTTGRVVEELE